MSKQKLFKILSFMGIAFFIAAAITFVRATKNLPPPIEHQVELKDEFIREFNRVVTRNRAIPIEQANFVNPLGQPASWDDFKGEYLLVNFWATWCGPCIVELPPLGELEKRYAGKGLKVIAISVDINLNQQQILSFIESRGIGEFAGYWDNRGEVQKNIPMRGIPTTKLLDKKGNVLRIFEGEARWDSPASYEFFDALLNSHN